MKENIETGIRLKAIFIYVVVAVVCCGMIVYVYSLRQGVDRQREHIEQYYRILALTNELVYAVNHAQLDANLYVTSKKTNQLSLFKQKTFIVEQLIDSLATVTGQTLQDDSILKEINRLLRKKGSIVFTLHKLFNSQSPIDSINRKLQDLNMAILTDSLSMTTITTVKDTVINTTPQRGFWRRLGDVFSSGKIVDTVVTVSTMQTDTIKLLPEEKVNVISAVSDLAKQARIDYSSHITDIERQVYRLIMTDQEISTQISTLLNEFSRQTIDLTLGEIRRSEQSIRKNYTFSIIGGGISLLLILIFIVLIIKDVNKGYAARKELEQANIRTRQIMESRHQLLLSVSHDIKTPLSSVLGYLELWHDGNDILQQQVSSMQNSGKHILALLENLLEFSSLERGTLVVSNSDFNLWKLCTETAEMFIPLASQKNLSFDCEFAIDKNTEVHADVLKINQIIINILSNAIKYTPSGHILFEATYDRNKIHFCICDTGAGIPKDQMDVLFKPFARVDQNNALASGSGLGMYVVKGLINLLHGEINVTSTVGKGTQIEVMIPAKIVAEKSTKVSPQNILVIDDDLALLSLLRDMMAKLGHEIEICSNPEEFCRQEIKKDYDLIITDMEMGNISGIDVLEKLHDNHKKVAIIVMTGRGDFNESKAIEAGFAGYLPKPVTMDALSRLTGDSDHSASGLGSLEELLDGDKQAIAEVLSVFVHATNENIDRLRDAIAGNDFKKAQALCHKMLPMFMQVGVTNCIEFLQYMDSIRSDSAEKHPFWRGKTTDFIGKAENFIAKVRKNYLT